MENGDHVAVPVGANLVRMGLRPGSDHILNRSFKTARAGGLEKILEKLQRPVLHATPQEPLGRIGVLNHNRRQDASA
jgi:hypothetical protein